MNAPSLPVDPAPASGLDQCYMARALQLAALGLYTTDPNPRVGCVLVHGDQVVGEGWHRRAGEPHAERNALAQAGERARGATAYVTLEPCCHFGRTPPCVDALIAAGVARVVCAMVDPNPLVAGQGLRRLVQAGIAVTVGVLEESARALNPGFIKRMEQGLPHVRCKLAASLDGRTAMASGESRWITSEQARLDVQRLRARASAILTGIDTVLADDPSLNVRLPPADLAGMQPEDPLRQPLRVVLDSRWRMPAQARMLTLPGTTLVVGGSEDAVRQRALAAAGAQTLVGVTRGHQLDLPALVRELARREVNELHLEAGATLAGAMLTAGLVDEFILYMAPHLMGDAARGLFHLPGLASMDQRLALEFVDVRHVGPDLRITARPRHVPDAAEPVDA